MRIIAFIIIYLLLSCAIHAQLIENRLNIYLSYSVGNFCGSETINEANYITPSLYSNFHKLSGFSVKGLINSKNSLSYGLNYDYKSANKWSSSNYSDFEESEIQLHTITPFVRVQNKLNKKGLSNKLLLFIECGPTIGFSNLALSKPLFEIQASEVTLTPPMSDNNFFAGLKGNIGLEYSFTHSLGFFFSYSYGIHMVSSKLYNDNSMMSSIINVGLVMKFKKDKYFYY